MKVFRPVSRRRLFNALVVTAALAAASAPLSASRAQQGRDGRGLTLQPGQALSSLPAKSKRWALVIGVDRYRDSQISPLRGAANDAHTLADALVRHGGFPADQVVLLSSDQPEERQPTRVNILRRLSNLASVVPKDGLLLVSFAGHGMERGGQAYLLPADAQINDDVTFMEETAVSVARMKERIRATGVGQVIVLLDACRNDPGGRADAPNLLTEAYTKFNFDVRNREVQAFAVFYAAAVGQRAYEYSEKRQGYFTWAVVEGLRGGAANERGEVTLAQLVRYVQETVPKRIGIDLGSGKQQRPFAVIEGYRAEDLVVAAGAAGGGAPAPTQPPAVDTASLERSFWDTIKDSKDPADFRAYLDRFPDGVFAALARRRAQPPAGEQPAAGATSPPAGAVAAAPADVAEVLAQAERDYRDKDFNKAFAASRGVLASQPDNARANLLTGLIYLQSGRYTNSANYLTKAVTLGEKVTLPIQHHHYVFLSGDAFCSGGITVGRDGFAFNSTSQGGHDFLVPLTRVYELVPEQMHGGRLRVKVGIQKETKEDRKTYNFYLPKAYLSKNPKGVVDAHCDDCAAEVGALSQLIQQLIQAASSGPAAPASTGAAGAGGSTDEALLRELLELERVAFDAGQRGDKATVERMMAAEFVQTQDGKTYDRAKLLAAIKPSGLNPSLSYEEVGVAVNGETATLTGIAVLRGQRGGAMATVRQKFTDTFVKREGRWLVLRSEVTTLK